MELYARNHRRMDKIAWILSLTSVLHMKVTSELLLNETFNLINYRTDEKSSKG